MKSSVWHSIYIFREQWKFLDICQDENVCPFQQELDSGQFCWPSLLQKKIEYSVSHFYKECFDQMAKFPGIGKGNISYIYMNRDSLFLWCVKLLKLDKSFFN